MNDPSSEQTSKNASGERPGEVRQKALQEELRELVDVVGPAPLVDLLLERAFQLQATDIHLDPTDSGLRVRLRVDGLLHDVLQLPPEMMPHVLSRVKLMANMDITERRLAQDGHISNAVLQHQRDVRVGSGPTIHGERIVLRLMPDATRLNKLEELGFEDDQIADVTKSLSSSYGMILSVGPVGCGKSTTMYSCLELLNDPSKSLSTIEDPVERQISGVNQIQIDSKIDFNFVEALRGVLRQDPDVTMIGEIRDPETAHIGCRAGLTGILVLSTLHANDAAATIDVFREFGIPPMFIADSLQVIISQRLIRKACRNCRTTYHPDTATCEIVGIAPERAQEIELVKSHGCDHCFHTGYHGRTGVFEIMRVNAEIRKAILRNKSHDQIVEVAHENGMVPLEAAIQKKVLAGVTTIEEMHRIVNSFAAS